MMFLLPSKNAFSLLLVLGHLHLGAADVIYSENFVYLTTASTQMCDDWNSFRAALTGNFDSVEYGGTNLPTVVLNDPTGATALANTLNAGSSGMATQTVTVAGQAIAVGGCGPAVEVSFDNQICTCASTETIRGCYNSYEWGGMGTSSCSPPTQTMHLSFYRSSGPTLRYGGGPDGGTGGGAGGDPHFKTWHGEQYDFHGHCDLVLLNSPHVADGHGNANQGLSIHIRSSPYKTYFSYVSGVAIRIGDDVLEVSNKGQHYVNGVPQTIGATEDFAGYKVTSSKAAKKPRHVYKIHLAGEKEEIDIREYRDWITVSVIHATRSNFGASVGLMGRFQDGAWVGRDNVTVHTDINEYGQDWQVRGAVDGFLFRVPSPYPKKCDLPSLDKKIKLRRLEESVVSEEEAMQACAHWGSEIMDCVLDVRTSGDLGMALNGPIAPAEDPSEDTVVSFTGAMF